MRLVGTTKSTIASIRERTHWQSNTLSPLDPVTLGLCSQIDLDFEVNRAAKDRRQSRRTTADRRSSRRSRPRARTPPRTMTPTSTSTLFFAKLKELKGADQD